MVREKLEVMSRRSYVKEARMRKDKAASVPQPFRVPQTPSAAVRRFVVRGELVVLVLLSLGSYPVACTRKALSCSRCD